MILGSEFHIESSGIQGRHHRENPEIVLDGYLRLKRLGGTGNRK
jgi:hypothetical protein